VSTADLPTPRRALAVCLATAGTVLVCAVVLAAAVLVPAPAVALPVIAAVCIGLPMVAAFDLPGAIAVLRATRGDALRRRHLTRLRRELQRLPETRHPLGL
jgi:short subunit fatty acids transporter